ncbi:MAG TPA: molybdopterin-dependent oxidoreductase, partial [Tepidisphaeraceae bacterium]|nr:molybdopterin-dependent oxidoreductase [Tepidisphaeraceae bacterium]
LSNPVHRAEVAKFWGVRSVPERPGKTAVEMFEAVRNGSIKILWIVCTNPAQSLPDQKRVHEALERAELVVVQDAYRNTETAAYADVFLPAAGWGEKEGTMTNSERRISRVRAAVRAPGEARPDWRIAVDFARRLGGEKLFPYEAPEEIFNEHRETTRGRDLDITGLSYALLDERGPQQWPYPQGATSGRKRLYEDGRFATPSGNARFVPTPYQPVAEEVDEEYPLRLTTGRLRDQWHSMSRTGTIAGSFGHEPEPRLMAHPDDLKRLGIDDLVRVRSRRGEVVVRAAPDANLPPGTVFLAMHWGGRFLGGHGVNALTVAALDPVSRQPELKHCAVRIEAAALPWRLVASSTSGDAAQFMQQLEPAMGAVPYALRTLDRAGIRLSLAAQKPPAEALLKRIYLAFKDGSVDVGDAARAALRGRTLCNCFDVAEVEIVSAVAAGATLARLQTDLKCGTGCGSCVPELRRLVQTEAV